MKKLLIICVVNSFSTSAKHTKVTLDSTKPEKEKDGIVKETGSEVITNVPDVLQGAKVIELGFVEKLIELWRLRTRISEATAAISVKGTLSKYTYRAGESIMNKTMEYSSSLMEGLFKNRNKMVTIEERQRPALIMYENYICQTKALLQNLLCEQEFEIMINAKNTGLIKIRVGFPN